MAPTVDGIAPCHSKYRIQRRRGGRGHHHPLNEIRTEVEGPNIMYRVARRALDRNRIRRLVNKAVLVDLRNIYDPKQIAKAGFVYTGIGRITLTA
jgi:hypothetical protein